MMTSRAFFAATVVHDQFIYVFGGMENEVFLNTLERYDEILNSWNEMVMKLPVPLAKCGAVSLEPVGMKSSILILGGID
jgi:N-acetylneuraminic acid mutarotase